MSFQYLILPASSQNYPASFSSLIPEKAEGKDKDKKEKRDESPSKRKVKFNDDASGVSSSSTTSKKKVGKLDSKFVNMLGAVLDKDD